MKIKSLHIHPIKSCAGISVPRMELDRLGPIHDREFMVIKTSGEFVTQRTSRKSRTMCLVTSEIQDDVMTVTFPNGIGSTAIDLSERSGPLWSTMVWKDSCVGREQSATASAMFSELLGEECHLIRTDPATPREHHSSRLIETFPVGFADGYPILVISTASLADLNARMGESLPMDRFRPNVVISGEDCPAYTEDAIPGLWAGDLYLQFAKLCSRCPIPSIDQQTGVIGPDPRRTLRSYRAHLVPPNEGPPFGSNYVHRSPGTLEVDAELRVA